MTGSIATLSPHSPMPSTPQRLRVLATALAITGSVAVGGTAGALAQDAPATVVTQPDTSAQSVADVAEIARPAVVTIYTFVDSGTLPGAQSGLPGQSQQSASEEPTPLGAGSGWIYSEDGYVVTNAHVVSGADSFTVQYEDGTQVEATLVGTDVFQDVAVLKLDLGDGESIPAVARVGDSSAMRAGDEVVAIGSPLGEFTNTVSDGNIGGLDRSLDGENGVTLDNLIQHDAEISPGNSGGPLLNMEGEVIGMNVAKVETTASNGATATGLNFAIDGNTVVSIVDEIIEKGGSVEYPYLGVQTQLTEDGPVVMEIEDDGPAADAGIERGDILVAVDGEQVDADTSFMDALLQHEPGETVTIQVERGGSTIGLDVTLGTRPSGV